MGILVQPNKITFPKDSKRPNLGASLVACLVDDDDDDEWCSGGAKWRMVRTHSMHAPAPRI